MKITSFEITRFTFPRDRVIGDAQVRSDTHYIAVLELRTDTGLVGTGFLGALFTPLPDVTEISRIFSVEFAAGIIGQSPSTLIHRVSRPRGGHRNPKTNLGFASAIDTALWDLAAQEVDLPLYRYMGGSNRKVPVYASMLGFHLDETTLTHYLKQAMALGYTAFKVKVGHPDLEWDIKRLELVQSVVGKSARIMIDANETWSPKEAIRRIKAFERAGIPIFWAEDPIMRDDIEGLRLVKDSLPDTHLNTGEYVSASDKRRLIEENVVDILNIHGFFADGLRIGWLAAEYGIPISLGNTPFEVGIHLAAALPECIAIENAFQNYIHLLQSPVEIRDGYAYAPDVPGHGLKLSEEARELWSCPRIEDDPQEMEAPYPILMPLGN